MIVMVMMIMMIMVKVMVTMVMMIMVMVMMVMVIGTSWPSMCEELMTEMPVFLIFLLQVRA